MSNVLKVSHQSTIQNLIAKGWSQRRIARELGLNRRTVARYADSKCTTQVTPGSATASDVGKSRGERSACATLRMSMSRESMHAYTPWLLALVIAISACVRVETTEREVVRYDRDGKLQYFELSGMDYADLLTIIERETGRKYHMARIPSKGLKLRFSDPEHGWETIIQATILAEDPSATYSREQDRPKPLPLQAPPNTQQGD